MVWIAILVLGISYWIFHFLVPPSEIQPVLWEQPDPLPYLNGSWSKNEALVDSLHLNDGLITAPESIAINPLSGVGYASLSDGRVVSLDQNGLYLDDLFFVGGSWETDTSLLVLAHSHSLFPIPKVIYKLKELLTTPVLSIGGVIRRPCQGNWPGIAPVNNCVVDLWDFVFMRQMGISSYMSSTLIMASSKSTRLL
jgi:hypothetical protein